MRTSPITPAELLGPLNALADATRLHLLLQVAAYGETRAQELLLETGQSQPNLSRHLKQLVAAGLLTERRAGDANKLYAVNTAAFATLARKLTQFIEPANARASAEAGAAKSRQAQALAGLPAALQPFLDDSGRITHYATRRAEQQAVLGYLMSKLAPGRRYSEPELTELIAHWLAPEAAQPRGQALYGIDPVTLRRALVEEAGLRRLRDGSAYWREG